MPSASFAAMPLMTIGSPNSSRPLELVSRKLASPHQQVVGEPALVHGDEPSSNIGPAQPFGIAFVVDLVSDSDEPIAAGRPNQRIKSIANVG